MKEKDYKSIHKIVSIQNL